MNQQLIAESLNKNKQNINTFLKFKIRNIKNTNKYPKK